MQPKTSVDIKTKSGSFLYQYLATITGCLSILCSGMHFGWPSPSLPQLLGPDSPIPMTNDDGSWLAVMPCIGAASGSLLTACIVDRIGRKTCMMATAPVYVVCWVLVAVSPSVLLLIATRFVVGAADGIAFTAFPMYLGEIADSKIRGLLGSSIQLTMNLALLMINVIGSYLSIFDTALVSTVVPVLHFATFWFMPESPYYLIMRGKAKEATESLQMLNGREDVSAEMSRLGQAVAKDLGNAGRIWDLFTVQSNRKAVVIIAGLRAAQQLSGINVIAFYAKTIFLEAGSDLSPSLTTITYFSVQLIMAVIASFLVDKLGRKPLLVVSIIGSGLALAAEGIYFYLRDRTSLDISDLRFLSIVALVSYVIIFNLGMGTIPVLMLGELFPTSVKAFALCLADIYFGLIVTAISKFFQIMKDDLGIYVPFFAFASSCVLGLVFVVFYVPETKGKTLEEIQQHLKGDCPKESQPNLP